MCLMRSLRVEVLLLFMGGLGFGMAIRYVNFGRWREIFQAWWSGHGIIVLVYQYFRMIPTIPSFLFLSYVLLLLCCCQISGFSCRSFHSPPLI